MLDLGVSLRQRVCRRHVHVLGQCQRQLAGCMCLVANPSITPLTPLRSAPLVREVTAGWEEGHGGDRYRLAQHNSSRESRGRQRRLIRVSRGLYYALRPMQPSLPCTTTRCMHVLSARTGTRGGARDRSCPISRRLTVGDKRRRNCTKTSSRAWPSMAPFILFARLLQLTTRH